MTQTSSTTVQHITVDSSMTVDALRIKASEMLIVGRSRMTKPQLIEAINARLPIKPYVRSAHSRVRTGLVNARRATHNGRPCSSCTGATWSSTTGRTFEVRTSHGQAPNPVATTKQTGRRFGPAPRRLQVA